MTSLDRLGGNDPIELKTIAQMEHLDLDKGEQLRKLLSGDTFVRHLSYITADDNHCNEYRRH